jgi:hypothetical protein
MSKIRMRGQAHSPYPIEEHGSQILSPSHRDFCLACQLTVFLLSVLRQDRESYPSSALITLCTESVVSTGNCFLPDLLLWTLASLGRARARRKPTLQGLDRPCRVG